MAPSKNALWIFHASRSSCLSPLISIGQKARYWLALIRYRARVIARDSCWHIKKTLAYWLDLALFGLRVPNMLTPYEVESAAPMLNAGQQKKQHTRRRK
jgi:hypothetical protein